MSNSTATCKIDVSIRPYTMEKWSFNVKYTFLFVQWTMEINLSNGDYGYLTQIDLKLEYS